MTVREVWTGRVSVVTSLTLPTTNLALQQALADLGKKLVSVERSKYNSNYPHVPCLVQKYKTKTVFNKVQII